MLWDKPYLSSLKESFEASLADASSSEASEDIDIDIDDSNSRPPVDINLPVNGPTGIVAPGDISPTKPTTGGTSSGADSDEALTAPNASSSQGKVTVRASIQPPLQ